MGGAGDLRRVRPVGLWLRTLVTAAVVITVTLGTAIGNDDWWPFAPMSQYAFLVKNDGVINSPFMEARTVDGDLVGVTLSKTALGIERSEIEGQLPRLIREPFRMQAIAVLRARRAPDEPAYVEVFLRNRVTKLDANRTTTVTELAHWVVINPEDPAAGLTEED